MKIYEFDQYPLSIRHGSYGGAAGDKDGIKIGDDYWIVKYPKNARYLNNVNDLSYVSSPLSEFLGSQIYKILGFDVHDTILGIRNDKLVVACKDFIKNNEILLEMRTIRNAAHKEIDLINNGLVSSSSDPGNSVDLEETIFHLKNNIILKKVNDCEDRFWECCIIDIFINNNDRNNGNWGIILDKEKEEYYLAPVYDNGNAFYNKFSDEKIKSKLESKDFGDLLGTRTAYIYKGHIVSSKKFFKLNLEEVDEALLKVYPMLESKIREIDELIETIPEEYNGYKIFSKERKAYYKLALRERLDKLIRPAYEKASTKERKIYSEEDIDNLLVIARSERKIIKDYIEENVSGEDKVILNRAITNNDFYAEDFNRYDSNVCEQFLAVMEKYQNDIAEVKTKSKCK